MPAAGSGQNGKKKKILAASNIGPSTFSVFRVRCGSAGTLSAPKSTPGKYGESVSAKDNSNKTSPMCPGNPNCSYVLCLCIAGNTSLLAEERTNENRIRSVGTLTGR